MERTRPTEQLTPRFSGYPAMVRRRALQLDQASGSGLERHFLLFLLAVEALRHLTSVAFGEYAVDREEAPVKEVEDCVARLSEPTIGRYVRLLTACTRYVEERERAAGSRPDADQSTNRAGGPLEQRRHYGRFGQLPAAVEQAVKARAAGLVWMLPKDTAASPTSWLEFWELLREYRNGFVHFEDHRWHEIEDYFEVANPIFEAAVLDAVTSPYARERMTRFALADVYATSRRGAVATHRFKGEFEGREDLREVEVPDEAAAPWLTRSLERGHSTFLLRNDGQAHAIVGPGHDFSREPKPPPPIRLDDDAAETANLLEILADHAYAPSMRRRAARKLGYLDRPDARVRACLRRYLSDDPDERVREACAKALGRLPATDQDTLGDLVGALAEQSERVRFTAAIALGRLRDERAVAALVDLLSSESAGIRHDAAASLRDLADSRSLGPMLARLSDEQHPSVRHRLAEALARLGDREAVAPLLDALQRESDELAWGGIAWALAQLRDQRPVPTFVALLDDDRAADARRTTAAYVLGLLGGDAALRALRDALLSASNETAVRVEAAWALWEIADESVHEPLQVAQGDPDTSVAAAARAAIANLLAVEAVRSPERWLAPS